MSDFAVNYKAGQRIVVGETLYQSADGHWMFKYLPSAALLYVPLAALPINVAMAVWFAASLAALAGLFWVANRLVPRGDRRYLWVVAGLVLAKFFLRDLRLGQINILLDLVMATSLLMLSAPPTRATSVRAGALTGVAIALKPYAAIFLPYLVLRRRWSVLAAAVATLALLLLLPAAFYGLPGNWRVLQEWATTLEGSTQPLLTNVDNVSILAFFAKWIGGDPGLALALALVVLGVLAVLTLAVIVKGGQQQPAVVLEGALILTLIPLVSPLGWDYTFLLALLAVGLVLRHAGAFPVWARWSLWLNFGIIALAIYDVMGRHAYGVFMQWSITTLNFLGVVAALAYLRFKSVC
jgi:alpha-1,2-mannosyltransferase